jgi:hypothetical protein
MPPRRAAESLLLSFDEGQEGGIDGGQRGFEPRQPCGVGIHQDRMGAALRAKTGDFGTVAAADIGDQDDPGEQLTRGTVASTAQPLNCSSRSEISIGGGRSAVGWAETTAGDYRRRRKNMRQLYLTGRSG